MRHVDGEGRKRPLWWVPQLYATSPAMCVFLASASAADPCRLRPAGVTLQQGDATAAFLVRAGAGTCKRFVPWRQHTRLTNTRRVRALRRAIANAQSDTPPSDPPATITSAGSGSRSFPVRPLAVAGAGPVLMSTTTKTPISHINNSSRSTSDPKPSYLPPWRKGAAERQQQTWDQNLEPDEHAAQPALDARQVQQRGLIAHKGPEKTTQQVKQAWEVSMTTTKLRGTSESTREEDEEKDKKEEMPLPASGLGLRGSPGGREDSAGHRRNGSSNNGSNSGNSCSSASSSSINTAIISSSSSASAAAPTHTQRATDATSTSPAALLLSSSSPSSSPSLSRPAADAANRSRRAGNSRSATSTPSSTDAEMLSVADTPTARRSNSKRSTYTRFSTGTEGLPDHLENLVARGEWRRAVTEFEEARRTEFRLEASRRGEEGANRALLTCGSYNQALLAYATGRNGRAALDLLRDMRSARERGERRLAPTRGSYNACLKVCVGLSGGGGGSDVLLSRCRLCLSLFLF